MNGKTLGHYRVGEQLGRGGMGEVYVADDLSLDRKVALKFLPDAFTGDPERMARFEREAKVLASLNHPNIAAIYGLEQAEGKRFIVLELVEGETLAQRLTKGPLPINEALGICRQIAEGLEAAHEKGVIHRDLKPANVMITDGDKVKILDFGLAKALWDETQAVDSSHSPTLTEAMTQPGVILGTAAYMSPEQAKGKAVDKRADIWAFGCILYECLTGKRAFEGETVTETLAAILKGEPDWKSIPESVPWHINDLLRRFFQKNPIERLRDIGDARIEFSEADSDKYRVRSDGRSNRRQTWITLCWLTAIIVVAIVASLATLRLKTYPTPMLQKTTILLPPGTQITSGEIDPIRPIRTEIAISPDGKSIVFSASGDGSGANAQLYLRSIEKSEATSIAGTLGARMPFFSPDGKWIGFYADHKLQKILIEGGIPKPLCDMPDFPMGASWGSKGTIVVASQDLLQTVSDAGGKLQNLTIPKTTEGNLRLPSFLPSGDAVLFTFMPAEVGVTHGQIEAFSLRSGQRTVLVPDGTDGRYVPTGHLVFLQQGTLMAEPFDPERLKVLGSAIPILQGVMHSVNHPRVDHNSGAGQYAFSDSGTLLHSSGGIFPDKKNLFWVNRKGEAETIQLLGRQPFIYPRISPDGSKLAYILTGSNPALWIYDIARGTSTKLIGDGQPIAPVWTSNGDRIVFQETLGMRNIFWMPWDGSHSKEQLTTAKSSSWPSFCTRDNRLGYRDTGKICLIRLDNREVTPVIEIEGSLLAWPVSSPDNQWLAYGSTQSGQPEIYVTSLQNPGGRRIPISIGGGCEPLWAHNGRELFYWTADGKVLMAVDTVLKPSFQAGKPRKLFSFQYRGTIPIRNYDIGPDQRFLIPGLVTVRPEPVTQLNLVVNWFEELKRLVSSEKK